LGDSRTNRFSNIPSAELRKLLETKRCQSQEFESRFPDLGDLADSFLHFYLSDVRSQYKAYAEIRLEMNELETELLLRREKVVAFDEWKYLGSREREFLRREAESIEAKGGGIDAQVVPPREPQAPVPDEYTIKGKNSTLRRGNDGFDAFLHTVGNGKRSKFELNETEAQMVEKLWMAAKDGTTSVFHKTLLKQTSKKYEQVSKAFTSPDGKRFYQTFVQNDKKGHYRLNLDKSEIFP
jgi:hypothetical protein